MVKRHLTKFNTHNKNSAILEKRIISFLLLLSEIRQRCPLSLLLFNTVLQVWARKIMQEKEIKTSRLEGRSTTILFTDNMTVYVESSKESIKIY